MYKIGYAWKPGELENSDCWTLDIDYVQEEKDTLKDHGAIIQIHGESLSACMLRGRFICDLLNNDEFHSCEIFVQLLELAKVMFDKKQESENAESDS
jgi:hypothetical protein